MVELLLLMKGLLSEFLFRIFIGGSRIWKKCLKGYNLLIQTVIYNVVKMKEYLEKHYQESITRNNIEGYMHLSGDYMNRKFKKEIGYTLVEYIHYYRCNMAKNFYVMMI